MLKHRCELRFCTLVIDVPQIEAFELILVAAHKICRLVFMDGTFYYLLRHIPNYLACRRHMSH